MPDNLKCTVRFFALKYAWHTLGETISCAPIRNICTSNKRAVLSVNLKKEVLPDFQLSRNDPVDSSTTLRKSNDYRKIARPKRNIERPVEAKTITESVKFKRNTKSKKLICERDNLTSEIYQEYNKIAFDSLLPRDLRISWSNRLRSTAGITKMSCLVTGKVKVRFNWSRQINFACSKMNTPFSTTVGYRFCIAQNGHLRPSKFIFDYLKCIRLQR